jgi:hypothetical protein
MRRALLIACIGIGVLLALWLVLAGGMHWMLREVARGVFTPESAGAEHDARIFFLRTEGFDAEAPGAAILLHPLATGGDPIAVTDPALLAAAAATAYYTDDSGREQRLVLLSIVMLSPPANATRLPFVTLFRDGREIGTLTCFTLHCADETAARDLAGLAEAGRTARLLQETVTGRDAILAREAAILADPALLLAEGSEQLPPVALTHPGFSHVTLPAVFASPEDAPDFDTVPLEAAVGTAVRGALDAAGISATVDRIETGVSWTEIPVLRDGMPIIGTDGRRVTDGLLPMAVPDLRIWLDPGAHGRLRDALADLPSFGPAAPPDPAALAPRLPALIAAQGLAGTPDDYSHAPDAGPFPDRPAIGLFREPEVRLSWYQIEP